MAMQSRRDANDDVSGALDVTVENTASVAMDSSTVRYMVYCGSPIEAFKV